MGRSSCPAWVRWYSTMPAWPVGLVSITPACSSSLRRLESKVGDMRGTPRRRSLKRVLPHSSSRRISGVQRAQITSDAIATGQNWP